MGAKAKTKATRPVRHKPENLRVRVLSSAFTVNDIHASLAWYRDVIGFTVDETWEHEGQLFGAALKAGRARLVLNQDDWAKGRDRQKGEAMRVYLATVQDVDLLATDIEARGGTLESQPITLPWGMRAFNIVDPDGFKLTITSHT